MHFCHNSKAVAVIFWLISGFENSKSLFYWGKWIIEHDKVSTAHLNKDRVQNHQRQSLTQEHPLIRYAETSTSESKLELHRHRWSRIIAILALTVCRKCVYMHNACSFTPAVCFSMCAHNSGVKMREERTPGTANHLMSWLRSGSSQRLIGGWPLGRGGWSGPIRPQEGREANKAAALSAAKVTGEIIWTITQTIFLMLNQMDI